MLPPQCSPCNYQEHAKLWGGISCGDEMNTEAGWYIREIPSSATGAQSRGRGNVLDNERNVTRFAFVRSGSPEALCPYQNRLICRWPSIHSSKVGSAISSFTSFRKSCSASINFCGCGTLQNNVSVRDRWAAISLIR